MIEKEIIFSTELFIPSVIDSLFAFHQQKELTQFHTMIKDPIIIAYDISTAALREWPNINLWESFTKIKSEQTWQKKNIWKCVCVCVTRFLNNVSFFFLFSRGSWNLNENDEYSLCKLYNRSASISLTARQWTINWSTFCKLATLIIKITSKLFCSYRLFELLNCFDNLYS